MWTHEKQKAAQRKAMERSRFGYTREEIIAAKGRNCKACGQPVSDAEMVINHDKGQGRHATEQGMVLENTHNLKYLSPMHRDCAGRLDRERGLAGLGIEGTEK